MTAVMMWVRAEARRRWRAWLALAVVFGIAGGAAIAAAAGARRTETAYPRLLERSDAPDTFTGGVFGDRDDRAMFLEVMRIPQAEKAALSYGIPCPVRSDDGVSYSFFDVAATTPGPGFEGAYRVKVLAGRPVDLGAADEATLSFAAVRPGLGLGDRVHVAVDEACSSYIPLRVVGIHAGAGEFPAVGGVSFAGLLLSPAFYTSQRAAFDAQQPSNVMSVELWLKPGATVQDVRDELASRDLRIEIPFSTADHVAGVQKSMRFEAGALWLLAALLGVSTLAILGQVMARESFIASTECPRLRALGISATHLTLGGIIRAGVIAITGAAIAAAVAVALSPLTPLGLARIAEPEPGFRVDLPVIVVGAAGLGIAMIALAILPAWRAARAPADAAGLTMTSPPRPSLVAGGLARASAPPSAVTGVRFAFERGRGRTSVPTRSAIVSLIVAIAAITVASTFGASMNKLLGTPRLQGLSWDALADGSEEGERALRNDPRFKVAGGGIFGVRIDGDETFAVVVEEGRGLEPVIVDGRAPTGITEVALASKTMRDAGVDLGGSVDLRMVPLGQSCSRDSRTIRATVVGRAIVPPVLFSPQQPGEGAVLSEAAMLDLVAGPGFDPEVGCSQLIAFGPGLDRDRTLAEIGDLGLFVAPSQAPAALESLGRLRDVPFALVAVLALLAIASLFHALVTSVRRRASDIAILRTIGFVGRQAHATIVWQATTIVLTALAIGVPLGIAAGRWGWIAFAEQLAVVPEPVVGGFVSIGGLDLWTGPVWFVVGITAVLMVLANLIAAFPARAAARTKPAVILRSE